jgi:DNA ligase-1
MGKAPGPPQTAGHPTSNTLDAAMPTTHLPARRALLAASLATGASALAWPLRAAARPRSAGLALPLALEAPPDVDPAGHLVSEKYDGARALWDGHTLRFRSGLPIVAPAWFTARLPAVALDGELWLRRGGFEALAGAVRRLRPDDAEWRQIRYMVFELPEAPGNFAQRAARIEALAAATAWPPLVAVPQTTLPDRKALQARLKDVVDLGGEGLVLHRADADCFTGRSSALLKLKPLHDAEAVVVAHLPGRGKHAGRLGALRVRTAEGLEFQIGTGFSDAQREHPPRIGAVVTYTHRGVTTGEVPRFASFLRVREV